ncbi:hypothetical protein [Novipirellula aureliae]|nr:hypothetical protein [Novipirellula aureliae]
MSEERQYTPIGERVNQDVMHDNFVPKYSGLASVRPSLLILTGVWLIFVPMALGGLAFGVAGMGEGKTILDRLIFSLMPLAASVLAVAVLYTQTSRYRNREKGPEADA